MDRNDYLFAQRERREILAIERLLLDGGPATDCLERWLGTPGGFAAWYGIRIPKLLVLPPTVDAKKFPGDIDLMAYEFDQIPSGDTGLQRRQMILQWPLEQVGHLQTDRC